jgi:hypothetical protein
MDQYLGETCCLFFRALFYPEYGVNIFLRNVGTFLPDVGSTWLPSITFNIYLRFKIYFLVSLCCLLLRVSFFVFSLRLFLPFRYLFVSLRYLFLSSCCIRVLLARHNFDGRCALRGRMARTESYPSLYSTGVRWCCLCVYTDRARCHHWHRITIQRRQNKHPSGYGFTEEELSKINSARGEIRFPKMICKRI